LVVARCFLNCQTPAEVPVASHSARDWRWAVAAARSRTEAIRTTAREQVAKATGCVGDGGGDGLAESVLDTLQPLSSQECVCQDSRSAKQQGETRREGPTPVFGDRAWPRHPIAVFSQDWTTKQLWNIMTELAWCLVDDATVKFNGKAACQIAVPLLDPVPGYESPNYATSTSWSAAPGAPLLTGFVLCVWAVYEAHGGPGAPELAIMSVHCALC
jgi:hypothetical protein